MPVLLQNDENFFKSDKASALWQEVVELTGHGDDDVVVRFVSETESQRLNNQYRGQDKVTNVLTFSYGDETHDIALCAAVAKREAQERGEQLEDYLALLLVHAFLHAVGMDHEGDQQQVKQMQEAERTCLKRAGWRAGNENEE